MLKLLFQTVLHSDKEQTYYCIIDVSNAIESLLECWLLYMNQIGNQKMLRTIYCILRKNENMAYEENVVDERVDSSHDIKCSV